jgi:hypothetical protein
VARPVGGEVRPRSRHSGVQNLTMGPLVAFEKGPRTATKEAWVEIAYYKLGNYGTGTLWYLRNRGGAFVHFNRLQIAKLEPDGTTWTPLAPGWKVQ